jgi:hypothetical protein
MRANAAVFVLANLTVHAQNLEPLRELVLDEPQIKACSATGVQLGFSHVGPVIVHVVY